jgi:hypothetical protein
VTGKRGGNTEQKTDFQSFNSVYTPVHKGGNMGIPLPSCSKWVHTYTPASLSPSLSHSGNNENNDSDHKKYQEKTRIKTGAEDVTYQFTTG